MFIYTSQLKHAAPARDQSLEKWKISDDFSNIERARSPEMLDINEPGQVTAALGRFKFSEQQRIEIPASVHVSPNTSGLNLIKCEADKQHRLK